MDSTTQALERIDSEAALKFLALLIGFSGALTVTSGIIRTPIGVPGHSAVFWMPVLILAGAQRRPGLAAGTGVLGGTFTYLYCGRGMREIAGVLAAAAVVEACGGLRDTGSFLVWTVLTAAFAHLGKLSTKGLAVVFAGLPLNAVGLALLKTAALYTAFGVIAGAIAWLLAAAGGGIATACKSLRQTNSDA